MQRSSQQITEADLQLIEINAVQGPRRIVEFGSQSIYVIDIVVQDASTNQRTTFRGFLPSLFLGWPGDQDDVQLLLQIQRLSDSAAFGPWCGMRDLLFHDVLQGTLTQIYGKNTENTRAKLYLELLGQLDPHILTPPNILKIKSGQLDNLINGYKSVYAFALQPIYAAGSRRVDSFEVLVRPTQTDQQAAPYKDLQMIAEANQELFKKFKLAELYFVKQALQGGIGKFVSHISVNSYSSIQFSDDFLDQALKTLGDCADKVKIELVEETPCCPGQSPLLNSEVMKEIRKKQTKLQNFCGKLAADDLCFETFFKLRDSYADMFDILKLADPICKAVFLIGKYFTDTKDAKLFQKIKRGKEKVKKRKVDVTETDSKNNRSQHEKNAEGVDEITDEEAYRQHQEAMSKYISLLQFAINNNMKIVFEASITPDDDRMKYTLKKLADMSPWFQTNPFLIQQCFIQGSKTGAIAFQLNSLLNFVAQRAGTSATQYRCKRKPMVHTHW